MTDEPLTDAERRRIIEKVGAPRGGSGKGRRVAVKDVDLALARAMLREGWSYRQVGKWFGVSGTTVRRRIR